MTSPHLPPPLRQPRTDSRAGHRLREWNPQLSHPPASALEARLTRAFRMLGERSGPLVSMLYSRARPAVRGRATGFRGARR